MIQLNVCGPRGEDKIIDLCDNEEKMKKLKVEDLKKKIIRELKLTQDIRIVFGTKALEDSSLLVLYGITHMSNVHVVLLLPGGDGCGQEEQTNRD